MTPVSVPATADEAAMAEEAVAAAEAAAEAEVAAEVAAEAEAEAEAEAPHAGRRECAGSTWLEVILHEGMNRQVRKMLRRLLQ